MKDVMLESSYQPSYRDPTTSDDEDAPPTVYHGGRGGPGGEYRPLMGQADRQENLSPGGQGDFIIHQVPDGGKSSRWSHIEDLDAFYRKVYKYYQEGGFKVMMTQEIFSHLQFLFVICLSTLLVECVDYNVLFGNRRPHAEAKTKISDCFFPFGECLSRVSFLTWVCILVALVFWSTKLAATFYHFFQYWDIKCFYNQALHVPDEELESITWREVQQRLIMAQKEHLMCISNKNLTELDICHRILRYDNYMVAMVNKGQLPVKINLPFIGEKIFLSHGLLWNMEYLLFKGSWAPFNKYHLRDEYKKPRSNVAESLQNKIALLALFNLLLSPLIFLWQLLHCFYNYAELLKREPSSLGVRKWNIYGKLYLRHFNELGHELNARLNRAYKPANRYLELFVSPLTVVIAKNLAFFAGSPLGILVVLTAWDEDVLAVEHVLTLMTFLGVFVVCCRVFIPDENMVFCPEKMISAVVAHIHYFPVEWQGKAHTKQVMGELHELFPYTAVYLLQELLSPLVSPFILYFSVRPQAGSIVDFFRNFTVHVENVGDVCSFAEMNVRRHGHPQWMTPAQVAVASTEERRDEEEEEDNNEGGGGGSAAASFRRSTQATVCSTPYTRAEDGKTEMSLYHFAITNPTWSPPQVSKEFISVLQDQTARDAEALSTVREENNALLSSLHSLDAAGGLYSSLATNMLHQANFNAHQQQHQQQSENLLNLSPPPHPQPAERREFSSPSLLQSVHLGLQPHQSVAGRSSLFGTSSLYPANAQLLNSSRLTSTHLGYPPAGLPNVRQDLRRFGEECGDADVSLSALYLHEMHHRMSVMSRTRGDAASSSSRMAGGGDLWSTRGERRASLNELDEENLPLVEPSSPRLASSMLS